MTRRTIIGGLTLLLATTVSFPAAEINSQSAAWPQFRGPKRDDISSDTGLLKTWPKAGPPVIWQAKGVGSGFSSVAIAGGKVYTMGNKVASVILFIL